MKSDRIFPDIGALDRSMSAVSFARTPDVGQGSVEITNHPRGRIRDDSSGSGVLRAENADALICADNNPGLVLLARRYDLLVYEVSE